MDHSSSVNLQLGFPRLRLNFFQFHGQAHVSFDLDLALEKSLMEKKEAFCQGRSVILYKTFQHIRFLNAYPRDTARRQIMVGVQSPRVY